MPAETGSPGSIRKWAGRQAAHLQLEADKPGPGIRSNSQLYETVSLHNLSQTHTAAVATGVVRDLGAELALCGPRSHA